VACRVNQDQHASVDDLVVRGRHVHALDCLADVGVCVEERVDVLTDTAATPFLRLGDRDRCSPSARDQRSSPRTASQMASGSQLSDVQKTSPWPTVSVNT